MLLWSKGEMEMSKMAKTPADTDSFPQLSKAE
jgi:hypothetical protein